MAQYRVAVASEREIPDERIDAFGGCDDKGTSTAKDSCAIST